MGFRIWNPKICGLAGLACPTRLVLEPGMNDKCKPTPAPLDAKALFSKARMGNCLDCPNAVGQTELPVISTSPGRPEWSPIAAQHTAPPRGSRGAMPGPGNLSTEYQNTRLLNSSPCMTTVTICLSAGTGAPDVTTTFYSEICSLAVLQKPRGPGTTL